MKEGLDNLSLDQRVELIKNDLEAINDLIAEYQPFIKSCVSQFVGKNTNDNDEYGIGMMAFTEAIGSYDRSKGTFLAFARRLIKSRIIDYYRKEKKHREVLSLDYKPDTEDAYRDITLSQARQQYEKDVQSSLYRMEIASLKEELAVYHINFADLVKISPSHKKTRETYRTIIEYILGSPKILAELKTKKRLPVQELEKKLKIPSKIIGRGRKYIIAVIIVMSGNHQSLQEYLSFWG